jgi:hypothetical protein
MLGDRYIVVQGDNLWRIAAKRLGGGEQWPRIWRYNNRRSVVRVTGRAIPDPDRIYVGQVLLIPRLPNEKTAAHGTEPPSISELPNAQVGAPQPQMTSEPKHTSKKPLPAPHQRSLSERLHRLRTPLSYKYRLDARWPAEDVGTAILEVRMTGDLVLMSKKSYPATYVTSRNEIEHQVAMEANHAFGKLVSDSRFIYDPAQKRLTCRSMLVTQSTTPNLPATAIGVEASSNSPVPKLRAEIRIPKLEGTIDGFFYAALDNKIVVEITPKPQSPGMATSKKPMSAVTESSSAEWGLVLGAGLVVIATVIAIGAVVDEWVPVLGQLDDFPASAAVAALVARGLVLMGANDANLPKSGVPTYVPAKASVHGPSS